MPKVGVRFGSAGIPHQCKKGGSVQALECSKKLGLGAFELEFVRGVKLKEETAKKIKSEAEKHNIKLSAHAPYWVNCCATDPQKQETTKRNLFEAAQAASWAGARVAVFHPGYYQGKSREECFNLLKSRFEELREKLEENKIKNVAFGAETVGKKSQYGSLGECIELQQKIPEIMLVIDFAHVHARGDWELKTESDYLKIFDYLERELPGYLDNFHAHFSGIEYSEKGERKHIPLKPENAPSYRALMKVLAEQGYSGVIISESPKLEYDALKMKKEYLQFL